MSIYSFQLNSLNIALFYVCTFHIKWIQHLILPRYFSETLDTNTSWGWVHIFFKKDKNALKLELERDFEIPQKILHIFPLNSNVVNIMYSCQLYNPNHRLLCSSSTLLILYTYFTHSPIHLFSGNHPFVFSS